MKTAKTSKRALLCSVLSIALCLSMLIGTTFAWFTDTATTAVNKIVSGKLAVDIVDATNTNTSLDGQTLNFIVDGQAVDKETQILWEPGATFKTQSFKIKNAGTLAIKYKMVLNGATGDTMLLDVIKFSVVGEDGKSVSLDTFEGNLPKEKLSGVYYIEGHMEETAGNEYQEKTVTGLGLTVYATQDTVEFDSTTDQYDKDATYPELVSTATELQTALNAGKSAILQDDVALTEVLTVAEGQTAAIDLNGNTLTDNTTNGLEVKGTLIVEDTSANGKIALAGENGSINVAEGATLVVNSGTITMTDTNNSSGMIYCYDGGTAVINGGTLEAKYAPISGNNTTGNMNLTITGGTITAQFGPAIYMPSQGELTITGGTLNGGISLRMGQVNISGGEINSISANIDAPSEYYDYSGNAWMPDALYVFGGTYDKGDAEHGNSLNLNITGGTFNCLNDEGSAVAIYDLGKVQQTMNVNISGAALSTNATNRQAAQVLSLADIGVTSPKTGFGTYSGNVHFNVK